MIDFPTPKFIIDTFEKCKRGNKESRVGFGDVKSFSIFKCIIQAFKLINKNWIKVVKVMRNVDYAVLLKEFEFNWKKILKLISRNTVSVLNIGKDESETELYFSETESEIEQKNSLPERRFTL